MVWSVYPCRRCGSEKSHRGLCESCRTELKLCWCGRTVMGEGRKCHGCLKAAREYRRKMRTGAKPGRPTRQMADFAKLKRDVDRFFEWYLKE